MGKEDYEEGRFRRSVIFTLSFVFVLWFIKAYEWSTGVDLSGLGILPRTLRGSIGIVTGPLVHGDLFHLLSNTFPIILLGIGVLYFYPRIGLRVVVLVYLLTGTWVWIAARDAYHIGASGLVYGLFSFILIGGFIRKDRRALVLSMVTIFLYGGSMFSGLMPVDNNISWESHLLGLVAGIFCAIYFKSENIVFASDLEIEEEEGNTDETINIAAEDSLKGTEITYHYIHKPKDEDGQQHL